MHTFTLPETRAALERWREITGLDETSPEWGEVWQVLKDTGLLAADGDPQGGLFDDPALPPGDMPQVRTLRLAIVGGALLHRDQRERGRDDVAACTSVTAALLERFYGPDLEGLPFEQAVYRLQVELPQRIVGFAVSPAVALKHSLEASAVDSLDPASLLALTVGEACNHDDVAQRVFDQAAGHSAHFLALAPLCTGWWLVYNSSPTL